jgi:ribokinase
VVRTDRLPAPGETVLGGVFETHQGGKGGNQAVAAARVLRPAPGRSVTMIGAVGADDIGRAALEGLRSEGIDVLATTADATATGVALIVVDQHAENQIAVAPGANAALTAAQVTRGLEGCVPSVVVASLEVPEDAVRAAGEWCRDREVPFVLNPAPMKPWARDLLELATHVTPNEVELKALGDVAPGTVVVETHGAGGVTIRDHRGRTTVPGRTVEAVDATGAGDCFNGVLAAGLLEGRSLDESVARAVVAAALSVTRAGAREGMPTREALDRAMRTDD